MRVRKRLLDKLIELYQKEVFWCKKCSKNTKQIKFIIRTEIEIPKLKLKRKITI